MDNKITKKRVFDILQIGHREDFASRAFDIIIAISIVLNITALVMSTFDEFEPYYEILDVIEAITICIFCVEYALRIWTAEYLYPELDRRKAVLRFFVSFDGIIDLLTILPFFFLYGFAAFRMLRVAAGGQDFPSVPAECDVRFVQRHYQGPEREKESDSLVSVHHTGPHSRGLSVYVQRGTHSSARRIQECFFGYLVECGDHFHGWLR